ncbi:acyltransferase ChoActase/COT/CPT [Chytriomyces sp. MP71]|nr:acyltransferase ChoActase/COT/CPT [Chytriomyces sp. MP71]
MLSISRTRINQLRLAVHPASCMRVAIFSSTTGNVLKGETAHERPAVPRLPVPALNDTVARYLASVKPLLSAEELARTNAAVQAFARDGGFGQTLQQRLRDLDAREKNSWLENIWLQKAYLEWRDPSLINVNWWCQFRDPKQGITPTATKAVSAVQITRAAGLIYSMLDFKEKIDNRYLPQEFMKDSPLCMNQYNNIFAVSRIPGEKADTISSDFPSKAKHIIVHIRDQMYRIDVIAKDGSRVSVAGIAELLRAADQDSRKTTPEPPVGVLTAGHRDTNFKGYSRLQTLSQQNVQNHELIRTSLFNVCLDIDGGELTTPEETHTQLFHNYDAHNRWFDKAIQLIVLPSGRAGVNGEHTPTDAVIPGHLMDYIVKAEPVSSREDSVGATAVAAPQKLKWIVDSEVEKLIDEAQSTASALIADTFSVLLQTNIYGSKYIKDIAKASPDAYIQLALQLAWRRLHKEPTAVYESASIRLFKHGRTETIRSLTTDTWAFATAFDDASVSIDDKRALFGKAIKSQSSMARDATFGKGVDRHLLALRSLIQSPEEGKRATLFTDPAYIKSMYFKISSSNMSPGDTFYGGFGPVVPEGYGVNYAIGKDNLKFSISHKPSCPTTNAAQFREALAQSLADLQKLFEVEE